MTSTSKKIFIIIDAHALIHRAFHALPTLTTKSGEPIGAVYGFASILLKMIRDIQPDYMVAAFDLPRPTFRHQAFEGYKATRPRTPSELESQFPLSREILAAFSIPVLEQEGYEADDVIGSLVSKITKKARREFHTLVVTGDLDTLQLVRPGVEVYTLRKGMSDIAVYGEKEIKERFGGLEPQQLIDFKGLKGDPSDNIPGARGVGEKTAIDLIQRFGNIETLYEKINDANLKPRLRETLLASKDTVFFSKQLATIETNLSFSFEIEACNWKKNYRNEDARMCFQKLGFYSLVDRLPISSDEKKEGNVPKKRGTREEYETKHVKTEKEHVEFLREMRKQSVVALSYSPGRSEKDGRIEIGWQGKHFLYGYGVLKTFGRDMLLEVLNLPKPITCAHDFKEIFHRIFTGDNAYDVHTMKWQTESWFDVRIASYLLSPGRRTYELKRLVFEELGQEYESLSPLEALLRLYRVLAAKLTVQKLDRVFTTIEMPLIPVLLEMELQGIVVDVRKLKAFSQTLSQLIRTTEEKIYELAGESFNINSPVQLRRILFEKLRIPLKSIRKTPKGELSTSEESLIMLRRDVPLIHFILRGREYTKLKTTYTDTLPTMVDKKTGRLYTHFNQTGTATGRLASYDPNLQNIPIRNEIARPIRDAFIAEKGFQLVSFDYSQMELRIAAALSGDTKLRGAFLEGADIHRLTASELYGIPLEDVTPEMRDHAKTLNFGIIYGISASRFAKTAGISPKEAREFMKSYRRMFQRLTRYLESCKEQAHRDGYVSTFFGRRRYFPDIDSSAPEVERQAERMAANMPIQGTEADIIKLAMIAISGSLKERGITREVRPLLQIHDELLFEIECGILEKEISKILEIMKNVSPLSLPLEVDVKVGDRWGDMVVWKK